MSTAYEMGVTVTHFQLNKLPAIKQAAAEIWPFEYWFDAPNAILRGSGQSYLGGGESEEQFAQRLAAAIWDANRRFCDVEVEAVYLENLPCESYTFDREEFRRLARLKKGGRV